MGEERLDRMEKMLEDLIRIVGATNSRISTLENTVVQSNAEMMKLVQNIDKRLAGVEQSMFRLERLERRQDKTAVQMEVLEAEVSLLAR